MHDAKAVDQNAKSLREEQRNCLKEVYQLSLESSDERTAARVKQCLDLGSTLAASNPARVLRQSRRLAIYFFRTRGSRFANSQPILPLAKVSTASRLGPLKPLLRFIEYPEDRSATVIPCWSRISTTPAHLRALRLAAPQRTASRNATRRSAYAWASSHAKNREVAGLFDR